MSAAESSRVQEDLTRRIEAMADLFDRMADGLIVLDSDWRFAYVNPRAETLFQRDRDELMGRNIWDVFPDAEDSVFGEQFRLAMREQRPARFEEYYPPLEMWAAVTALPSPSGLTIYLSDITSQKRAEAALALSEGQLRAVIENSPSVIFMKDAHGTLLRVNDEFARAFGIPRDEVVGKNDYDLLPRAAADLVREHDRGVLEGGKPVQYEETLTVPAKEGRRTYLSTKFPLKDSSGRVYGLAGIATDITDRKQQEWALAASEQRFRTIFEEGPLGVALLTPGQRFDQVNDRFARMLGYTKDEMRSLTIADVTAEEDREESVGLARRLVEGKIPVYRIEKKYVRRDGSRFWASITGTLIRDDTGAPLFILAMAEEVTQRKLAETALREKDRVIRQAYTEVIAAVTGGKLVLMAPDEIEESLGKPASPEWELHEYSEFAPVRVGLAKALKETGMPDEDVDAYVLAASEAFTNAVKHADSGVVRVHRTPQTVQARVLDHGAGIDFENLPKAALVPGFSTTQTLGMGFTIMLEVCDRVLLSTQPGLTEVVLERTL